MMELEKQHYFILGIKGAAMANIADMLTKMGKHVTGVDVEEEFPTDIVLQQHNIQILPMTLSSLPEDTEVVIYSAAHKGAAHPLVQEAKSKGIPAIHQAAFLDLMMQKSKISIAVAGCHGKTTTSSLLAYALIQLQKNPSYVIGAPSFTGNPGSDYKGNEFFVIEADEYGVNPPEDKTPKFHFLHPTHAIITNIDFDHPDIYSSLEDTKAAFLKFMKQILEKTPSKALFLCADDQPLMEVAKQLPREAYVTYGTAEDADFRINSMTATNDVSEFTLTQNNQELGTFTIGLFGEKNVTNAAGVVACLVTLGFSSMEIVKSLQGFSGAKRRFELLLEKEGIYLFDDYAHHPHELEAIINAAKSRYPDKRVIVLFQPHTYSRTQQMEKEFIAALLKADHTILLPIFASARETVAENSISSTDVAKAANSERFEAAESFDDAAARAEKVIRKGDVVLLAGAGNIYTLKNGIIQLINNVS